MGTQRSGTVYRYALSPRCWSGVTGYSNPPVILTGGGGGGGGGGGIVYPKYELTGSRVF